MNDSSSSVVKQTKWAKNKKYGKYEELPNITIKYSN